MKDSGQLTFTTMGGDTVTVPVRSKHYIQQRGYAAPPGTGPAGETCGSCVHCVRGRRYRKCELNRACWTHGPRTDILARSPACAKWAPLAPSPIATTDPKKNAEPAFTSTNSAIHKASG